LGKAIVTTAKQMKMTALFSIDSVCFESISTTSAEKVAHCTEFFRKQVEYKGELIEEEGGKA